MEITLRTASMLIMLGAILLLLLQQLWAWRSRRQSLHSWAALWSLLAFVFISGRFIQHAYPTLFHGSLGTRIQFVSGFLVGIVVIGFVRAISEKKGKPIGHWIFTVTSIVLSLLTVTTTLIVSNTGVLHEEPFGEHYFLMHSGPFVPALVPYTLLLVGFCVHIARRSNFGFKSDRIILIILSIVLGLGFINDLVMVSRVISTVSVIDVAFFVVTFGVGYVTHRETEFRFHKRLVINKDELARSEALLRLVADSTMEGIAIHHEGKIVYLNRSLKTMLGYGSRTSGISTLWASESAEAAATALLHGQTVEVLVRRCDETTFPAELSGGHASLGSDAVGIITLRDLTERKRLETQLVFADRVASLGAVAAGVAHEINNPLTYILGNLEYIEDDMLDLPLNPHQRIEFNDIFSDLKEGCQRIQTIVGDLKMLSRDHDNEILSADIHKAIASSMRIADNETRHRARVIVKTPGNLPKAAIAQSRLGQVLLNLLINAAHATPQGNVDGNTITVTAHYNAPRLILTVTDTGAGIPEAVVKRIFDPFFTTKKQGRGTGLGLAICRNIITAAGGDITVETENGVGTTFRIELPTSTVATPNLSKPRRMKSRPLAQARILLVDDEPLIIKMLARQLKTHVTFTTNSGREAIELIRDERPDLVLCDIMMPEMGGPDVYKEVLQFAPEIARRFVFMTGGAFDPEATEFLANIDNKVLQKPLSPSALREVVKEALARASGEKSDPANMLRALD